ncbi:MAG: mechanosensitive ion channel domain-containing protein [Armatimonadota bacterium]
MQPTPTPSPVATIPVLTAPSFVDDLFSLPGFRSLPFQSTLKTASSLLLIILLFFLLRMAVNRLIRRATDSVADRAEAISNPGRAARVRTLGSLITSIVVWTLGFVFTVSGLAMVGFPIASLLASAGVAGVAIGFGAQKLVKDVITGFLILLEDQYAVGEYVTIGTVTGIVEDFGMRITRIRDDDGKLYILSNGDIAQVCNQSRGPVGGSFEIGIASTADIDESIKVLNTALVEKSHEMELAVPAAVRGISGSDATKTSLSIHFRVGNGTRPGDASFQLRQAARAALLAAGIPLA